MDLYIFTDVTSQVHIMLIVYMFSGLPVWYQTAIGVLIPREGHLSSSQLYLTAFSSTGFRFKISSFK